MKSHFYLLRTSFKNRFKEVVKKPGKIVLYLFVLLGIAAALTASLFGASRNEAAQPVAYLFAIFFAFLVFSYALAILNGLASGNAIFDMSDVNLLFVSPVNPRATLLYGIIRMAGMSFWAGFFILFQSNTLKTFGVGFGGVWIIFGAFILNMLTLNLLSLVIYSVSNGNPARKMIVRVLAIAVFIPLSVFFIVCYSQKGDMVLALNDVIESPVLAATPFMGWSSAGAIALIEGNLAAGFGWFGLLMLVGAGTLLYIMFSRSDYYEDVLVATETAFERKRAMVEGDVQSAGSTTAKVKVKRTGLAGRGANVFLYKHFRETFRKNRFGFFGSYTVIIAVCIIGAAWFLFKEDDIITVLQVLMWFQIFMIGTGRGLMELYSHYIYMIPTSPFKKAIWSNMEVVARMFMESILFLGIPGLVMGSNPLIIFGSMTVYVMFSLMLLGINYLSMHWTETNISKGVLMIIYFFIVILFLAPGLAAALIVGFMVKGLTGTLMGLLILSCWELLVALICFNLSKNILHNCDMPAFKQK